MQKKESELERMIEVMKSYKEGKIIQIQPIMDYDNEPWVDCEEPNWDWSNYDYRVKPGVEIIKDIISLNNTATITFIKMSLTELERCGIDIDKDTFPSLTETRDENEDPLVIYYVPMSYIVKKFSI